MPILFISKLHNKYQQSYTQRDLQTKHVEVDIPQYYFNNSASNDLNIGN